MTAGTQTATERVPASRGVARVLASGAGWNAAGQIAPLLVNIILTPFLIQGLGLDRYGLYMLLVALAGFLGSIDGGVGAAAQRYLAVYAGTDDRIAATRLIWTICWAVTAASAAAATLLLFMAPLLVSAFHVPTELQAEGVFLLRTSVVVAAFAVLRGLFVSVLVVRQRYAFTTMVLLLLHVVYVAAAVTTLRLDLGLRGIAVGLAVQSVLATVLIVPRACRFLDRRGISMLARAQCREFASFALKVQLVGIAYVVNHALDALIAGALLPVRFVGLLQAGATFGGQLRRVPVNAIAPIQALLGATYGAHGERVGVHEAVRLQREWVRATTGFSVVALAAAYFAVTAWLGPGYELSGWVATLVVAGNTVGLWACVATVWSSIAGRPGIEARYAGVTVVSNVALTLVLVKPFGLLGIVTATAASQVVAAIHLSRVTARQEVPLRSFFREVPVGAGLVTLAACLALQVAVRPLLPQGPLGILSAAAVAAPGLVFYLVLTRDLRRYLRMIWR